MLYENVTLFGVDNVYDAEFSPLFCERLCHEMNGEKRGDILDIFMRRHSSTV